MAREDYMNEVALRNSLNKQRAMQAASSGAQAAAKAEAQRAAFAQLQAQMAAATQAREARGGRPAFTPNYNDIPSQFANTIQSVPTPAFRDFSLDPRAGGGTLPQGVNTADTGVTQSVHGGAIDWDTTPWYMDKKTGAMRILPANNQKEGMRGAFGLGGSDIGRETGMTDEEFKLAWAQQIAMGKEPPSWGSTRGGFGTDAPSKAEALKILQDAGSSTGVLEPDKAQSPRITAGVGLEAEGTGGKPLIQSALSKLSDINFGPFSGGGDPYQFSGEGEGSFTDPTIRFADRMAAQNAAANAAAGRDDAAIAQEEVPKITTAVTPPQPAAAPAAPAAPAQPLSASRNVDMDDLFGDAFGPGEGGATRGSGGSTAAVEAQQEAPWTDEQWRQHNRDTGSNYQKQADGSWVHVAPAAPAPAPAPKITTQPAAPTPADLSAQQAAADALTAAALERQLIDEPTSQDVFTASQAPQPVPTPASTEGNILPTGDMVPSATAMGTPGGTPADMFANVAQMGTPLWQAAQDPYQQYQRYRMAQAGGAPIGTLASEAGQRALSAGYQPAFGRFLLGGTEIGETGLPRGQYADEAGEGQAFGQYLAGGQRRDLGDIRSLYGGLGSYLGQLGTGTDPSQLGQGYTSVFGLEPERKDILSATQAALGMGSGMGQRSYRNLGTMYDLMQQQYGPQGAGRFADWVGTAFQPQEQRQQFQQPAIAPFAQQLGTQQLQTPKEQWDEAYQGVKF